MFAKNLSCGTSQAPVPALPLHGSESLECVHKFTEVQFLIPDVEIIIFV